VIPGEAAQVGFAGLGPLAFEQVQSLLPAIALPGLVRQVDLGGVLLAARQQGLRAGFVGALPLALGVPALAPAIRPPPGQQAQEAGATVAVPSTGGGCWCR
jgi:hypothetical protein